jgi:hypothetical protein
MATVELIRTKCSALPKVSGEISQLARDAQLILGHSSLADQVLPAPPKLKELLRQLDIEIISWNSVEPYQKERMNAVYKKTGHYHYWRSKKLKDAEDVPPFVLRKAIQIARACPEVKFTVEALEEDPDPFLLASLNGDTYYIEVWDEPDFEKGIHQKA